MRAPLRAFTSNPSEKLRQKMATSEKEEKHSEPSETAPRHKQSQLPDKLTRKEWRERLNNTDADTTYIKGPAKQNRNYQRKHPKSHLTLQYSSLTLSITPGT